MEYEIAYTEMVERWIDSLRDPKAVASISYRIDRIQEGNFGDHKSVGKRVSELRITQDRGIGFITLSAAYALFFCYVVATKGRKEKMLG